MRIVSLVIVWVLSLVAFGQHSLNADFSAANNPSGVWEYGYRTTETSAFTRHPQTLEVGPLRGWGLFASDDGNPTIVKNFGDTRYEPGTPFWNPGDLTMHPGPDGELSSARFTAPRAGRFRYRAHFQSQDSVGATVEALVYRGETVVHRGYVDAAFSRTFVGLVVLAAGETLEVAVDRDFTYFNDTTLVEFTVDAVGEPIASQTFDYTVDLSTGSVDIPIQAIDPLLPLTRVHVVFWNQTVSTMGAENTESTALPVLGALNHTTDLARVDGSTLTSVAGGSLVQSVNVPFGVPFDGTVDYAGPSGRALPLRQRLFTTHYYRPGALLNAFRGSEPITMRISVGVGVNVTQGALTVFPGVARGRVTIYYTYAD